MSSDVPVSSNFPLRLPPDLREWLGQYAKSQRRSRNAQIVFALEQLRAEALHNTGLALSPQQPKPRHAKEEASADQEPTA